MAQPRRQPARRRTGRRALGASGAVVAACLSLFTLAGAPVAGVGPVPSLAPSLPSLPLPSLPIVLPSLPLPTVPLPTVPVPTLPVPTLPVPTLPVPTLPVPTLPAPTLPSPTLPLPSLPIPTGAPAPTGTAPAGSASPSASSGPLASPAAGASDPATQASLPPGGVAGSVEGPTLHEPSPFGFALPLLIAGIPLVVIALIVALQIAGGAAWLPVIRRWLNRTPAVPDVAGVGPHPRAP